MLNFPGASYYIYFDLTKLRQFTVYTYSNYSLYILYMQFNIFIKIVKGYSQIQMEWYKCES